MRLKLFFFLMDFKYLSTLLVLASSFSPFPLLSPLYTTSSSPFPFLFPPSFSPIPLIPTLSPLSLPFPLSFSSLPLLPPLSPPSSSPILPLLPPLSFPFFPYFSPSIPLSPLSFVAYSCSLSSVPRKAIRSNPRR